MHVSAQKTAPASRGNVRGSHTSLLSSIRLPEIWVRFLLALLGLAMAFGAALLSTVTRETGNLWATLILASSALLLAVLVGLTTVPYLARRVALVRMQNAFDYEVTRTGIVYVLMVVIIGIAALNTGNNLLYIIVAAMLSAILCSGIVSAMMLRGLELEVRAPQHMFAGRAAIAQIRVRNPRPWPAFSINVVASRRRHGAKQWRWVSTTFAFPAGRAPEKQWFRLPDRQLRLLQAGPEPTPIFDGPAYFPHLPGRKEAAVEAKLCFRNRGLYQQEGFGLSTRFPFAFLSKTRRVPLRKEIVVYPSVEQTDEFFEVLPLINGERESWAQGRGSGLYRIREYTSQDSVRHLDWKATAKTGMLMLREFTREDERKLRVIFDNPAVGAVAAASYENAIGLAASLAWHFTAENAELTFASQGFESSNVYEFLAHLATLAPGAPTSVIDHIPFDEAYNVVITGREQGTIPTGLWDHSYFVFISETGSAKH